MGDAQIDEAYKRLYLAPMDKEATEQTATFQLRLFAMREYLEQVYYLQLRNP